VVGSVSGDRCTGGARCGCALALRSRNGQAGAVGEAQNAPPISAAL
jgi:hypothetical protein